MAVDASQQQDSSSPGGIINMIESHPAISIAVLVVIGALIFSKLKSSTATSAATTTSNTSGLQTTSTGQAIVYVPTTSSFTTINANSNNSSTTNNATTTNNTQTNSNNNNTNSAVGNVGNTTPVATTTTKPVVTPPPAHSTPVAAPAKYGLVWGAVHVVTTDDTNQGANALAHIASQSTKIMQTQQHAPSSISISAGDIVKHNAGLRTNSILKLGQKIILPSYERIS